MVDTESFKRICGEVHNNKYCYDDVDYINNATKVKILCHSHGHFLQIPANHSQNQGCPLCAKTGIRYSLPTFLYVIAAEELTKVGISNTTSKSRLTNIRRESGRKFEEIKRYSFETGYVAALVESKVISWLEQQYINTLVSFAGMTECFEDVSLSLLLNKIEQTIKELQIDNLT